MREVEKQRMRESVIVSMRVGEKSCHLTSLQGGTKRVSFVFVRKGESERERERERSREETKPSVEHRDGRLRKKS